MRGSLSPPWVCCHIEFNHSLRLGSLCWMKIILLWMSSVVFKEAPWRPPKGSFESNKMHSITLVLVMTPGEVLRHALHRALCSPHIPFRHFDGLHGAWTHSVVWKPWMINILSIQTLVWMFNTVTMDRMTLPPECIWNFNTWVVHVWPIGYIFVWSRCVILTHCTRAYEPHHGHTL